MCSVPGTLLLSGALFVAGALYAQVGVNPPIPPSWSQHGNGSALPNAKSGQHTEDPVEKMLREQKAKRESKQLDDAQKDAAKLVELANDLKKQVDESTYVTVSAKASSQADQIIKLAKSIKSKMHP